MGLSLKKLPYKSSFKRAFKIEEYNFIQNSKKWWMDNAVPDNKCFSLILTFLKIETYQKFYLFQFLCLSVHQGHREVWVQIEMEGSHPQILLLDGLH